MASFTSFVDSTGAVYYRAVRGSGTTGSPYEQYVVDADLNAATGSTAQAPANKATLTTTGTTAYTIIQLLKGILINSGSSSGSSSSTDVQYEDGTAVTPPTGNVVLGKVSDGTVAALSIDTSGNLLISENNAYLEFSSGSISIGTVLTTVVTVDVRKFRRLNIQIQNTGTTALSGFSVQGRYNSSLGGFYNPRAAATADFTTNRALQTGNVTSFVYDASSDLTALGGSTSGWIELNVEKYESIRVQAKVTTGTTTLKMDGVAKNW